MPLEPGPLRDLLAKLSEAERGDAPASTQGLTERLGWSWQTTRARCEALVERGLARRLMLGGVPRYEITDEGRTLLDG